MFGASFFDGMVIVGLGSNAVNANDTELSVADSLRQCCFCPGLQARDKASVLIELVAELAEHGLLGDRDGVLASVVAREREMSTGMQDGIALPHGKHASVAGLVSVIGTSASGIDFDALDGQPSHIFVMTISPPHTVGPHLRFLASVGRLLGHGDVRRAVMAARDKTALLQAFS